MFHVERPPVGRLRPPPPLRAPGRQQRTAPRRRPGRRTGPAAVAGGAVGQQRRPTVSQRPCAGCSTWNRAAPGPADTFRPPPQDRPSLRARRGCRPEHLRGREQPASVLASRHGAVRRWQPGMSGQRAHAPSQRSSVSTLPWPAACAGGPGATGAAARRRWGPTTTPIGRRRARIGATGLVGLVDGSSSDCGPQPATGSPGAPTVAGCTRLGGSRRRSLPGCGLGQGRGLARLRSLPRRRRSLAGRELAAGAAPRRQPGRLRRGAVTRLASTAPPSHCPPAPAASRWPPPGDLGDRDRRRGPHGEPRANARPRTHTTHRGRVCHSSWSQWVGRCPGGRSSGARSVRARRGVRLWPTGPSARDREGGMAGRQNTGRFAGMPSRRG